MAHARRSTLPLRIAPCVHEGSVKVIRSFGPIFSFASSYIPHLVFVFIIWSGILCKSKQQQTTYTTLHNHIHHTLLPHGIYHTTKIRAGRYRMRLAKIRATSHIRSTFGSDTSWLREKKRPLRLPKDDYTIWAGGRDAQYRSMLINQAVFGQ